MEQFKIVAKTLAGLEEILAKEVEQIGGREIAIGTRMVSYMGDKRLLYKSNLWLRTALRVLKPIAVLHASDPDELYAKVKAFDWLRYIAEGQTIAIDDTIYSDNFRNSRYAIYRCKDAICDHFVERGLKRPKVAVASADVQLNLHISDEECTLSLDSSGEPLYKRGYKEQQADAPISEVLAAGILLKAGWDGSRDLFDPMCGSGTFLIEAALIATNTPPGIYRKQFGFQRWTLGDEAFDADLWQDLYDDDSTEREFRFHIFGADISRMAIQVTAENVRAAGLARHISLEVRDFETTTEMPRSDYAAQLIHEGQDVPSLMIVTNPPYGKRLFTDVPTFYRMMGSVLKAHFHGAEAWIITTEQKVTVTDPRTGRRSEAEPFEFISLKPSVKVELNNGGLPCQLRKYELFAGRFDHFRAAGGQLDKLSADQKEDSSRFERIHGQRGDRRDRRDDRQERRGFAAEAPSTAEAAALGAQQAVALAPSDAEAARQEVQPVPSDSEVARQDAQSVLTDVEAAHQEAQSVLSDVEAVRQDAQSVPSDAEAARQDAQSVPSDAEAARLEAQSVPSDTERAEEQPSEPQAYDADDTASDETERRPSRPAAAEQEGTRNYVVLADGSVVAATTDDESTRDDARRHDDDARRPHDRRDDNRGDDGYRKPYGRRDDDRRGGDRKPYGRRDDDRRDGGRKPFRRYDDDRRFDDRRPYGHRDDDRRFDDRRPYGRRDDDRRFDDRKPYGHHDDDRRDDDRKPFARRFDDRRDDDRKPFRRFDDRDGEGRKPFRRFDDRRDDDRKPFRRFDDRDGEGRKPFRRFDDRRDDDRKPFRRFDDRDGEGRKPFRRFDDDRKGGGRKPFGSRDGRDAGDGASPTGRRYTPSGNFRRQADGTFKELEGEYRPRGRREYDPNRPMFREDFDMSKAVLDYTQPPKKDEPKQDA